jgi:DNA-binding response OmpR family regulator
VPAENRSTVLVVEDEASLLEALSAILRRKGFGVIQAADGTAALEYVRDSNHHIDALLLDLTVPGTSSREVFEELVRLRPAAVPIVMSAYSRESVKSTFEVTEVPHFIRKPFRTDDLLKMLREVLPSDGRTRQS